MLQLPGMNEPEENSPPQKYLWPWYVLAAFLLAVVLAVAWMGFAVKRQKQERDFSAPLPSSTPR